MSELAGPALQAVVTGNIHIHPGDRFLATYKNWLENVKDWCISRQLWWGQQIPAWYAPDGSFQVAATREEAFDQFITAELVRTESLPDLGAGARSANGKDSLPFTIDELKQDEDVLDTWFSSWLWPIEVFKGITDPGNPDINYYYPGAVLVTGQDIIFFWVARMIMAGLYEFREGPIEKRIPFKDVYFTGMVRDKQGRKMSKSLGNSPDLLELIEKYGADAVRFGIMISSPAGNDLLFDEGALEQGRHFNNKLWNALKLVKGWEERAKTPAGAGIGTTDNFAIKWFDNRLREVSTEVEKLLSEFRLNEALKTIYSLIWDDFCSWYLEWIKPGFEQPIDIAVYEKTIDFYEHLVQLLHPFMPFVTEEIYHLLKDRKEGDDLCMKQFKAVGPVEKSIVHQGSELKDFLTAGREFRQESNIKFLVPINHVIFPGPIFGDNENVYSILKKQLNILKISFGQEDEKTETSPADTTTTVFPFKNHQVKFETGQIIDASRRKEELQKELVYLKGFLESVNKKLGNERFVQNAKPDIVSQEVKKKTDAEAKIKVIEETLSDLN
jgi:valyl-tRNA synthetase